MGLHALLSATLKVPELALDPREGAQLAAALANLQKFYPVHVTEKALAWGNMLTAVGMIYGTRFAAISARKAAERKNPQPQRGADIIRPNFQASPRPTVTTPPPNVLTPDGDPTQAAPVAPQPQHRDATEAMFAATPPELM